MAPQPSLDEQHSSPELLVALLCLMATAPLLDDDCGIRPSHSFHHSPDQAAPGTLLDKDGCLSEAEVPPPLQPCLDVLLNHHATAVELVTAKVLQVGQL